MVLRAELLQSFEAALRPVGVLDRFKVSGVIATWWGEAQNDLRTLAARGFPGLVEAWVTSIRTAMEDRAAQHEALEHRLVKELLPDYLETLAELEAKKAELDATIKGAESAEEQEEGEEGDGESEETLSEEDLKNLRAELGEVRKTLKTKQASFVRHLEQARAGLDDAGAENLVLAVLRSDLDAILGRYVADHRQQVIAAFESWWDKYRVPLSEIEREREEAAARLRGFLARLSYA
jgi:type I restriction enzyme M protein